MTAVTRQATSDLSNTGGFTTTPLFSKINDSSDATLIVGTTQPGGRVTFGFTAFSLPSDAAVTSVDIHYRHRSTTTGNAYAHGSCIKVGATYYGRRQTAGWDVGQATGVGSGSAIADVVYVGALNPATGLAWTYSEVNALTEFGVSSNDFNPDANFYQVDITVNYTTVTTQTKTGTALGRIKTAFSKTGTAKSRMKVSFSKTETAKARILVSQPRTMTALAAIVLAFSKTGTARGRILASLSKTTTAKARTLVSAARTATALARVLVSRSKTGTTLGRILAAASKTAISQARVLVAGTKTGTALARVLTASSRTANALARIASGGGYKGAYAGGFANANRFDRRGFN